MTKLQIIAIGDSVGVVLPKEMLSAMGVDIGATLYAVETANGIELSGQPSNFAAQMDIAEDVMRANSQLLSRLSR